MSDDIRFILSLSIVFAVIIGIVRFRKMDPSYYPFIYNCFAAFIVEILNRIFTVTGHPVAFFVVLNIYSIVDFYLFLWLFHNWGLFGRKKTVFVSMATAFIAIWAISNVFITRFITLNYYFFILYFFFFIFFCF